ncbi:Undecaprenyl-phosphate alpha-N-acetylglucosaminyl 1-phosphate transferase [Ralstonia mannitolilytica]|uniref:MraY family glycosyltransferase n=1 Tax=Ralstonia mannitolilytica TaxID=105219 RepID=UPI0007AFFC59|nr:glycosyltransferase [Ralstonia mannitolilytica]ANA34116.1 glycosyl transferase [Ralstonia mannitolilytica]CAJ0737539.1 Undecaprenyl-phosphate alpha-N-acetylglucosaminyl 1-phosphate transferase [Ralstonia mannitolilytica]CAJ0777170.1 Undecaprenyl-phosphate alpha-N-acetylglucosaminyl 1-phosphate transferase [Ralstonia mannitolilytica]
MLNFSIGFIISFCITMLVVRYAHLHSHLSGDDDLSGAQKFHTRPVPRIGGSGIAVALVLNGIALWMANAYQFQEYAMLIGASIPAFLGGLIEDLTKRVSARDRLIATVVAALLAVWLLNARITLIDIPGFGSFAVPYYLSIVLTALAVAGLANAINIIDGFNGLAAIVATMMFLSLALVAFHVGDVFVLSCALVMAGAILGFFLWNFPGGHIFLGDGGAYLIGFMLGELAVLLTMRHVEVSAWYPVLMFIYPIFETLFSIYRKQCLRGISPGIPDGIHLHMLIYKRLMRWVVGSQEERHRLRRNSFTSPYLWLLSLLAVLPATLFWNRNGWLIAFVVIFVSTYVWLYWSIVRFRVPRWMIVKKKHHD